MKHKLSLLSIIILLSFTFSFPVMASASLFEETSLNNVTDYAFILTTEEVEELEEKASEIEDEYDFGVYIITMDDFREYSNGDVFDSAKTIYEYFSLGRGTGKDGILLLLSMEDRDYSLMTYGDRGNYTFTTPGREKMTEYFLDDFAENDWYYGFNDYLSWCEEFLKQAEEGTPYDKEHLPMDSSEIMAEIIVNGGFILGIPLAVAGIVVFILNMKMKSVAVAAEASAYMMGGLELTRRTDTFTHVTETRRKIERNNSSGGGGGSSSRSSGSASGTSGKF